MFKLVSKFRPIDEQKRAAQMLSTGIESGYKDQVLLGVTGSGKTFTLAQIIKKNQRPTLIISHNKTLAGQLYQEMRDFFPENAVCYFVSYYDFYQPEAYIPQSDTYIEKEAEINEVIDKLRLAATSNLLTRDDVIVVASVSCIYNIGSPVEYGKFISEHSIGDNFDSRQISQQLVKLQYDRSEFDFKRGTFRLRVEAIDIYPAYEDIGIRLDGKNGQISKIIFFEPLTGKMISDETQSVIIYPAKHYMTDPKVFESAEDIIRNDLEKEYRAFKKEGKLIEAERLLRRVSYDLEMIKEMGYVNGIENYSRYFDGRRAGEAPYTLLDYYNHRFGNKWQVFVDESHMTVPQIGGMYNGDKARKETLINFGFRLKAAIDNRPLKFEEFYKRVPTLIYTSATPANWEMIRSKGRVAQQLVRPTGIVDPEIEIRRASDEVTDLVGEVKKYIKKGKRILVTALTKRMAEDLSSHLTEKGFRSEYLHSEIKTLERGEILNSLREGKFDILVGINLLREGLDLPEVSLVAILDADNEGFLRSKTSLIQTMGRAARNVDGKIIIYTDKLTNSITEAIKEVDRRRHYQLEYNYRHNITPKSIEKSLKERIIGHDALDSLSPEKDIEKYLSTIRVDTLTPLDRKKVIKKLTGAMKIEARNLNFETAISIRDKINEFEQYPL